MRSFALLFVNARAFSVEPAANNWLTGHSGEHLSCFPNHYIDGVCASAEGDDCNFSIIGRDGEQDTRDKYSFGIHCIPAHEHMPIGELEDCNWMGGYTGTSVACRGGKGAYGWCSTSQQSSWGGECNYMSHQVKCCDSDAKINHDYCGWIYDKQGHRIHCPSHHLVAGFCGVNHEQDCHNGENYVGIQCCPLE